MVTFHNHLISYCHCLLGATDSLQTVPFFSLALSHDTQCHPHRHHDDAYASYRLDELLYGFSMAESIDGLRSADDRNIRANSQTLIEKLPRVLVLQLKRFAFDASGARKLHYRVSFKKTLSVPRACLVHSAARSSR